MLNQIRFFLARLLIGKTPYMANIESRGVELINENAGSHIHGCTFAP